MSRPISRRSFLLGATAAVAVGGGSIAGAVDTTSEIELVEQVIPIVGLPSEFVGYRIGFLTDLHIGDNVPFGILEQALEMVRAARIDLLLFGGDFIAINDSLLARSLKQHRTPELIGLPAAKHPAIAYAGIAERVSRWIPKDGAFAVLGNHDRWVVTDLCRKSFSSCPMPVLVNELQTISRGEAKLHLYGTDDYWNGVPSLSNLPPRDSSRREVRVLLNHNPDYTALVARHSLDVFDLAISGHTHGGQIKIPGLGAISYNIDNRFLGEGLHVFPNGSLSYTSRGLGVVEVPIRINCPAEATIFELARQ